MSVKGLSASLEDQKRIANWLQIYSSVQTEDPEGQSSDVKFNAQSLVKLSQMVGAGSLNSTAAKEILSQLAAKDQDPEELAKELNLIQISDDAELEKMVDQVMADNPKPVSDLRNGEEKAIGFLVGQIMKISGGKANPSVVQKIIRSKL